VTSPTSALASLEAASPSAGDALRPPQATPKIASPTATAFHTPFDAIAGGYASAKPGTLGQRSARLRPRPSVRGLLLVPRGDRAIMRNRVSKQRSELCSDCPSASSLRPAVTSTLAQPYPGSHHVLAWSGPTAAACIAFTSDGDVVECLQPKKRVIAYDATWQPWTVPISKAHGTGT
jgi:hypothetical protein